MVAKRVSGSLALTVHGPSGVIDLMAPPEAMAIDIATEYAAQCRLPTPPLLHTRRGALLPPHRSLNSAGITTGSVLIASGAIRPGLAGSAIPPTQGGAAKPGPIIWFAIAVAVAGLAGWFAAQASGTQQEVAIGLLGFSAVVGVLPIGRLASYRMVAAPAFGGAAAFALEWSAVPERLPTIIGAAALAAALTAAVARALDSESDEALRVWIVSGVGVFLLSGVVALIGWEAQAVWTILLLMATLAARLVPGFAVDVPDQYLLDLERLAVSAWSARERPSGRRGRTVVPLDAVAAVAERGTRLLTAAGVAIWVVCAVSAPLLLASATLDIDRVGARLLVVLAGAALLLAARSYRHAAARAMLRGAGLTCWVAVLFVLLEPGSMWRSTLPAVGVITLAVAMVLVAVATGRGWRSAWWSRRAEVAEGLVGSAAFGAAVVAVGLFRSLWELKFRV